MRQCSDLSNKNSLIKFKNTKKLDDEQIQEFLSRVTKLTNNWSCSQLEILRNFLLRTSSCLNNKLYNSLSDCLNNFEKYSHLYD